MAYDEELADRFRNAVDGLGGIVEKRMMGGVCFMLDGNMLGGANRQKTGEGRFMFRVGKDNEAEAMKRPGAMTMEQGGRKMTGLIFVYEDDCDAECLQSWIALALTFVGNLPPK
ncbi:MAG: TfoX/Sxy family protein [Alphaproteobacteria bacterium]